MGFDVENDLLLALLRDALADSGEPGQKENRNINWDKWLMTAGRHSVLPLLYPVAEGEENSLPHRIKEAVQKAAISTTRQSYRLLFLSKFLVAKLEEAGLTAVILKGVATASFYPVPEYRKSGDVDLLLLDRDKLELCSKVLADCGCVRKDREDALHHVTFLFDNEIEVELHTLIAEPFDNRTVNKYLENLVGQCAGQVQKCEVMGVKLPVLKDGYHGYELLLHMLQHFLRAGFGLKLLCDWVVFWNKVHEEEECLLYLQMVRESGMKGFSDMVTLVCCRYLGLERRKVDWMELGTDYDTEEFMREVLEAEEFGRSSSDRMVVLRGNSLWDYMREFHHQMRLSFPRAGKVFLCWPVLWLITFIRFVGNNRKVRNVSTKAVFSKAAQRSKVIQQMKLWKS